MKWPFCKGSKSTPGFSALSSLSSCICTTPRREAPCKGVTEGTEQRGARSLAWALHTGRGVPMARSCVASGAVPWVPSSTRPCAWVLPRRPACATPLRSGWSHPVCSRGSETQTGSATRRGHTAYFLWPEVETPSHLHSGPGHSSCDPAGTVGRPFHGLERVPLGSGGVGWSRCAPVWLCNRRGLSGPVWALFPPVGRVTPPLQVGVRVCPGRLRLR